MLIHLNLLKNIKRIRIGQDKPLSTCLDSYAIAESLREIVFVELELDIIQKKLSPLLKNTKLLFLKLPVNGYKGQPVCRKR
jgi:hypothetical protein